MHLRPVGALIALSLTITTAVDARLVLRRVIVHGEPKTRPNVVAARMNLRPGDEVSFEKLESGEQRLLESELFSAARVYLEMPRDEAARRMYLDARDEPVDVHVEVVEKQSWFVIPVGSFGSGDYAGGIAYGDQNFFGNGVKLLSAAQIGQSRSYVFAGYRDPRVAGTPLTFEVAGLFRHELIRFFDDHREIMHVPATVGGGEFEVGWMLSPHLHASLGFNGRYQRVVGARVEEPEARLPAYNNRSGRIFRLVFQALYDNTSAPVGLRRGVRFLMKNEVADQFWGSQFDYIKFEGRTEFYAKFGWNYPSLIVKTVLNFPTSPRGVPITEILRIGGANLRGYLFNEFHGDTLVSAQLEDQVLVVRGLKLPLVKARFNLAAAGFVDAATLLERHPGGTAVELPVQPRPKLYDIHTSVGVGVRAILPGIAIPAIKADIAYGIDVRSFGVTISVGGGV